MIDLLVTIVVAGLIFYLLWWLVGYIGLPEPFNKVLHVVIALIAVIWLLGVITGGFPRIGIGKLNL